MLHNNDRREVNLLLAKARNSLVLGIEFFNRPVDRGRTTATLILIDHAFEMFMKAAILYRGGSISVSGSSNTIGFDACIRRSISSEGVKYLTEEQALILRVNNGLRDAAQHYILDISERQLYLNVQSSVILFGELLYEVFQEDIALHLPDRVLPVSTSVPTDLIALFETEIEEVKRLLNTESFTRVDALARLRPLAILDSLILGDFEQPSDEMLEQASRLIQNDSHWHDIFQGASSVRITADETGPAVSIRITKSEGTPVHLVPQGTPGAPVVAVKRVNELGFYSLGAKQLAEHLRLSLPKTVAAVEYFGIRDNPDLYKEIAIGKTVHKRYSQRAIHKIRERLEIESIDYVWAKTRKRQ